MKVLLINPPSPSANRMPWFLREERHSAPDGTPINPYMAPSILAYVRQELPSASLHVLDALAEGLTAEQVEARVRRLRPDAVVSLLGVNNIREDRLCAELDYPTIGIITPVSADPREAVELYGLKTRYFTFGDEVEVTVAGALAELMKKGYIGETPGIFVNEGRGTLTAEAPLSDMTKYPIPAFELFPFESYIRHQNEVTRGKPEYKDSALLSTMKGCAFRCNFCIVSGHPFPPRSKSAAQMFSEVKYLYDNFGRRGFHFINGIFGLDADNAKEFCRRVVEAGLEISFWVHNRIEFTDESLLRSLVEAGCTRISYGIETVDQDLLRSIGKKLDIERAREVFGLTKKYGMKVNAFFMVGFMEETREALRKNVDFIIETKPDTYSIGKLFLEPGSRFYNDVRDSGLLLERDWEGYRRSEKLCFKHDVYRNMEEMERARRWMEIQVKRRKLLAYRELPLRQRLYEYMSTFDSIKNLFKRCAPGLFEASGDILRDKMVGPRKHTL